MRILLSTLAIFLTLSVSGTAETLKTLTWDDLLPELPPLEDPFTTLTEDQQYDIAELSDMQALREQGVDAIEVMGIGSVEENDLRSKLAKQGVDVEALLRRDQAYRKELLRRNSSVNESLNGQDVKIPGFALPLEFNGEAVTEFLLVPFVGACIHVPPPPINQTVFVRVTKPYVPSNLYDPVWVIGRMSVKRSTSDLALVDGQAAVEAGYTLEGGRLEPYKE
ncbi:hypothetical protein JCM17960_29480 [Magnetospira thiophila]